MSTDAIPGILGQPQVLIGILTALVPFHQAIVEVFKLTGVQSRRYWEALAYIVYGPTLTSDKTRRKKKYRDAVSSVPSTIDPLLINSKVQTTPQERLIESFLLRGVGDSPVTDISDSDIQNMIQVIRFAEMQQGDRGLAFASELLDELIRTVPHTSDFLIHRLTQLRRDNPHSRVGELIDKWVSELQTTAPGKSPKEVRPAVLFIWRNELNLAYFPAILRAERELPNALKAAEFQYVRHLSRFSSGVAGIEAMLAVMMLNKLQDTLKMLDLGIALVLCFGVLVSVPRGTKSLLDAVIGLGNRMKG